jgi:DNA polymerase type B, organellar and viral
MLEESIKYLMRRKYDKNKIYLHNFSYFDGIFLLRILSKLTKDIKPIIRDGRLIDIKFTYYVEKSKYTLYFRDSYLILPSSLRKLAINFQVESKGIFPYKFVNNLHIDLNYNGKFPRINFFDLTSDLSLEYLNYKNQFKNKS